MSFHFKIRPAASVDIPDEGRIAYFTDTDFLFKQKDHNNVVTPLVVSAQIIAELRAEIEALKAVSHYKLQHIITMAELESGYIDLDHLIKPSSLMASVDRLLLQEGIDYSLETSPQMTTRFRFTNFDEESPTAGSILFLAYIA